MPPFFAVCHGKAHGKAAILCRVPVHVAHGKGGIVCRVPRTGHTAKGLCWPCAKPLRHTANRLFHGVFASALYFAVGPILHTAKCLPCARDVAHGKLALCRPLFAVSCLPCVTLGKHFAECKPVFAVCPWHTANGHSPVVQRCISKAYCCSFIHHCYLLLITTEVEHHDTRRRDTWLGHWDLPSPFYIESRDE